MSNEVMQPRVGCGAMVRDALGRLLLVQRGRPPEQGHWGLPGGKVDWMESVEDAVVREVFEETGLRIRLLDLLCLIDHFEPLLEQHWVAPVYEAEPVGPTDLIVREPDVLTAVGWYAIDALPHPLTLAATRVVALTLEDPLGTGGRV